MIDSVLWNTECYMRINDCCPSAPSDCEESGPLCNRIDHLLGVATLGWSVRDRRRPSDEGKWNHMVNCQGIAGLRNVPRIEGHPEGTTAQWRRRPGPDLIG